MLESGIINYGPEFMHSMEEGGWDLSKVDTQKLKESKATFAVSYTHLCMGYSTFFIFIVF